MSSKFGRGLYSAGAYSRDFSQGRRVVGATSLVAVSGQVLVAGFVTIEASSSLTVRGRLLWEHIPIEPCEGQWVPLVDTPCRRAA